MRGPLARSAAALAALLLVLLTLPTLGLILSTSPEALRAGVQHPLFLSALGLSARTTMISVGIIILTGTPLAWWLSSSRAKTARVVELLIDLPVVIPPAVVGVALLKTYGARGLLGPAFAAVGIVLPFSTAAVIMAQVVVSAPFYVQAAAGAFRKIEPKMLLVARTLGATQAQAVLRVAIPVALPGLIGGAALAWARALGEFGATLLFAGNLPRTTQTMPLAIYAALETDVRVALALSIALAALSVVLLLALRLGPHALQRGAR